MSIISNCPIYIQLPYNHTYIHSDLNVQNSFHSTIDVPPGVSKNLDEQTDVHFGELER